MSESESSGMSGKLHTVAERARKATWAFEWVPRQDDEPFLRLSVPNGRDSRTVVVNELRAQRLMEFDFEEFRLLGSYAAINNPRSGYVEALLQEAGDYRSPTIEDIPGVEQIDVSESSVDPLAKALHGDLGRTRVSSRSTDYWRLVVKSEGYSWHVEVSPMTDNFLGLVQNRFVMGRRRLTLKIYGIDAPQHDTAVRILEGIGEAFLFDLDVRYGATYELALSRVVSSVREYSAEPLKQAPSLPRLQYPTQALSLYNYGRSASGMPLLQFLAYYQVLEHFFPMYSEKEVLGRLRRMINSPRFEASDDTDLARILQLVTASGRSAYGSEKDQLKATISGCVEISGLTNLFHSDAEFFRPLTEKNTIKGVPVIDEMNRGVPIADQVTARVYALRNRVVHAKADGGEMAVELLLPRGVEARSMRADIALVKFLAQQAIAAGGTKIQ